MESSSQRGQGQWSKVRADTPFTDQLLDPQPEKFRGSKFDTDADLEAFSRKFDEGAKRVFSADQADQYVRFGSPRDNDPSCGVKGGRLTLPG